MRSLVAALFIALVLGVIGSSPVSAQSPPFGAQPIDEHCQSDWSTREKWGTTGGMTWPQFLTYCRTHNGPWSAESSLNSPAATKASATAAATKTHPTKHPKRLPVQSTLAPATQ
jgi:hypothetical protein